MITKDALKKMKLLISQARTDEALAGLVTALENPPEELKEANRQALSFSSRLSKLKNDEMSYIISTDEANLERNKITTSILLLIEELEEE